jgi:hypothetical protein
MIPGERIRASSKLFSSIVEPLREARTKLADFFSILLEEVGAIAE